MGILKALLEKAGLFLYNVIYRPYAKRHRCVTELHGLNPAEIRTMRQSNPQRKRVKLFTIPVIALVLIMGVGIWLWFGERGFIRLYRTESERQTYMERIRRLARENQALLDEVHRLRTDMEYVESVARRQLDLVKRNEVIYRFDMEEPPVETTERGAEQTGESTENGNTN